MTTTLSTIDLVAASAATFVISLVITVDALTAELRAGADKFFSAIMHNERVPYPVAFLIFKFTQLYECPHCIAAWVAVPVTAVTFGVDVGAWFVAYAFARIGFFAAGFRPSDDRVPQWFATGVCIGAAGASVASLYYVLDVNGVDILSTATFFTAWAAFRLWFEASELLTADA